MSNPWKDKVICFDLDGTLCSNTNGKYEQAVPMVDRIAAVNKLYEAGTIVRIDTARGTTTGQDWHDFTAKQLQGWGVKYHTLRTGVKMQADLYVDDKGFPDGVFFTLTESVMESSSAADTLVEALREQKPDGLPFVTVPTVVSG